METSVRDLLASRGLRCTLQREMLYTALMASKVHPTAEELHEAVNRALSADPISLATVYNTLEAFTSHGLARRIAPTQAGSTAAFRYDADTSNHTHVVLADGSIRDLPTDLSERVLSQIPPEVVEEVERRMGVKVHRIGVVFEGGSRPDRVG
jgi:Fe2+ or Zn2+ uptake regulation protein